MQFSARESFSALFQTEKSAVVRLSVKLQNSEILSGLETKGIPLQFSAEMYGRITLHTHLGTVYLDQILSPNNSETRARVAYTALAFNYFDVA